MGELLIGGLGSLDTTRNLDKRSDMDNQKDEKIVSSDKDVAREAAIRDFMVQVAGLGRVSASSAYTDGFDAGYDSRDSKICSHGDKYAGHEICKPWYFCPACGGRIEGKARVGVDIVREIMAEKIVCNRENGSFSALWGRNCWVADSMLKLIESFIDPGEWQDQSPGAQEVCQKVEAYCQELRCKNREPHFDDVVWTEDRPV